LAAVCRIDRTLKEVIMSLKPQEETEPGIPSTVRRPNVAAGILKRVSSVAAFLIMMAAILFLAAGRLDWTWAWVYLAISLVTVLVVGAITLRASPETVAERGEFKIAEKWDKIISVLYALSMYVLLQLVAGLDVRFNWTPALNTLWHVAGAVVYLLGECLTAWAMIENTYFSTAVRIQDDRGHAVCNSGPYRFVRHPGYVGYIIAALGVPLLLGSLWALIPGLVAAASLTIRTSFEDRMLQAELPGYLDYVRQVRFRLVPGIW
jgi:protein-S-isoprenylcysteine O-methyltransferase Ste14